MFTLHILTSCSLSKDISDRVSRRMIYHNNVVDRTRVFSRLMYDIRSFNNQATLSDKKFVEEADNQTKYSKRDIYLVKWLIKVVVIIAVSLLMYILSLIPNMLWILSLLRISYLAYTYWKQHEYKQRNKKNKAKIIPLMNQYANGVVSMIKRYMSKD